MDDDDVLKVINDQNPNSDSNNQTTSFIFTLKNRVGGLARALRVFQDNGINVVHIESRKSKRTNSEYEIFVSLENQNGKVKVPELARSLKKQLSYIKFDSENDLKSNNGDSVEKSVSTNEFDDVFDTSNSSVINSEGVLVRKSKSFDHLCIL
jgi:hypothetical protein